MANTRSYFIQLLDFLSIDELNFTPDGFRNNIAWHFGHVVSVQQSLCYTLSGLPILISEIIAEIYSRGTRPERFITPEEIDALKRNMIRTLEQLKLDLEVGIFCEFTPYRTVTDELLLTIEDALRFNAFHERLHLLKAFELRNKIKSK